MLVIIDNIERSDRDEYLNKLSSLPCRLLVTGRCRTLSSYQELENYEDALDYYKRAEDLWKKLFRNIA